MKRAGWIEPLQRVYELEWLDGTIVEESPADEIVG